MNEPIVRVPWPSRESGGSDATLNREWLVTNGLGGYASGTLVGVITRRYHGYLVAALPAPFGRVMMFNDLVERLEFPNGKSIRWEARNERASRSKWKPAIIWPNSASKPACRCGATKWKAP